MNQTRSPIKPIRNMKVISTFQKFNVKYSKTNSLQFSFQTAINIDNDDEEPQITDINLKRALGKKLTCQKLSIQFRYWPWNKQIKNNLILLAKKLSCLRTVKFLNLKLPGDHKAFLSTRGLFANFIPKMKNLQSLRIHYSSQFPNTPTLNTFTKNLRKLPQLRHLALQSSYMGSTIDKSIEILMQRLLRVKHQLESLFIHFENLYIPGQSLDLVASKTSQFTNLKYLHLKFGHTPYFNDQTTFLFTEQIMQLSNLKALSLDISDLEISKNALQSIANLSNNFPKLITLGLFFREYISCDRNKKIVISNRPKVFSDEDLFEIGHSLTLLANLKHLTICCNNLRKTTSEGFVQMINMLTTLQNLKSLAIKCQYFRKIKNCGLAEIGCIPEKMPNLTSFTVSFDGSKQITDKGFAKFSENILASKTLKFLELKFSETNIYDSKIKRLEKMFNEKKLLTAGNEKNFISF